MTTYVEAGRCSSCGLVAKRDEDGNWWHVGPSCLPPHVRSPEVFFMSNSDDKKPEQGDAAARRQARPVADRQQRTAPADRSMPGSERSR